MKIYFMSSPRVRGKLQENLDGIYKAIEDLGHHHVTDFIVNVDVQEFYSSDIRSFHDQTINDLKVADICVFEATEHSLAVGHLIGLAIEQNKPIIVLYTGDKQSPFFLTGSDDDRIQVVHYESENIQKVLHDAIEYASEQQDTRFNFFISPKHQNYLDWMAKNKKIPRAVFLRRLIEEDMEENPDYTG